MEMMEPVPPMAVPSEGSSVPAPSIWPRPLPFALLRICLVAVYDSLYLGALAYLIRDSALHIQLVGAELPGWLRESGRVH